MSDLETRLRTTFAQVAHETTVPELHVDLSTRPAQRRRGLASIVAISVGVLAVSGAAVVITHELDTRSGVPSQQPPEQGTVSGRLPLCYGPGPNTNLKPRTTITVLHDGRLFERRTVASSVRHSTYELRLPAGSYVLHTYAKPDLHVSVQAGTTTSADFHSPMCL